MSLKRYYEHGPESNWQLFWHDSKVASRYRDEATKAAQHMEESGLNQKTVAEAYEKLAQETGYLCSYACEINAHLDAITTGVRRLTYAVLLAAIPAVAAVVCMVLKIF